MREKEVKINSPRILSEFETFIYKPNGKAEHEKGANDDLIIAFAIGLFIRDSEWERVSRGKNMYKAMLGAFSSSRVAYRGEQKDIVKASDELTKKKFKEKERPGFMPIMHNSTQGDGVQGQNFDSEGDDLNWLYD